jgi:hypothetical protein
MINTISIEIHFTTLHMADLGTRAEPSFGAQTKFGIALYSLRDFVSLFRIISLGIYSKIVCLRTCFAHAPGHRTVVLS